MKILLVFGTRPEAIKMGPIVQELRRRSQNAGWSGDDGKLEAVVCVTGQHREMLDQVLQLFDIQPDYDLDVMARNQSPTQVASAVLSGLESILSAEKPDWVLVQGDTTTVAAASLAAFYAGARVGHVEAGLRTFNKWRPFPEEINRRVAGVVSDLHFAPTGRAKENLLREGVEPSTVIVTGNPVIDALHWVASLTAPDEIRDMFDRAKSNLDPVGLNGHESRFARSPDLTGAFSGGKIPSDRLVLLVTAHRRENFGRPLENICQALRKIAERHKDSVHIIYPVHMNPNVWEPVHDMLSNVAGITLLPPLDYLPLVHLMKRAFVVLTDSGGIQEEAPSLSKPVLVLRNETERPEAVAAGTVKLVGTDVDTIVSEVDRLIQDPSEYAQMARAVNPYGDGRAAQRIVSALLGEDVREYVWNTVGHSRSGEAGEREIGNARERVNRTA